jgi:hypothetical protein
MATYLATYRIGDIVDIKANAAEQKGMVSTDMDEPLQSPSAPSRANPAIVVFALFPPE